LQSVIMSTRLAKLALMFGNFVIGVAILAPAGMLPELSRGLAVTIREAGLLVTFGAVVLCVGSPLVTWATSGIERRTLLSATIAVVAVGHAASALAPNYGTLLALRLVMVAVAAIYTPQAASTIALIVPAKERPSAIAFVFLGWSLALAAGLPLITFLAAHLGWRIAYGVLAALAALSLLLLVLGVPERLAGAAVSLRSWGRIVRNGSIILLLLITALTTSAAANSMQQARLVAAAPELSSATVALNTSSIYVGQALGSALGGFLFEHEHLLAVGYATVVFFGAALAVLALTRRRGGTLAAKG
jgi:predicted MFS family arabinose efflux permease